MFFKHLAECRCITTWYINIVKRGFFLRESTEERIDRIEELADERIEIYVQTVKEMQNKNQRRVTMAGTEEDHEEESWVPQKLLLAEQLKIEVYFAVCF